MYAYDDYEPKDNGFLKDIKGCAGYMEIKEWIKSEYGLGIVTVCSTDKRQKRYGEASELYYGRK